MSISKSKFRAIFLVPFGGFLVIGIWGNLLDHFLDSIGLYGKIISLNPQNWIRQFYLLTVPVWKLLLLSIVLGIPVYFLARNKISWKKNRNKQEGFWDLIDEFKVKYKFLKDPFISGIQYKTFLSLRDGNVYLERIEPYCEYHTTKLQMIYVDEDGYGEPHYKCPDSKCGNSCYEIEKVKPILYSQLEEIWDKRVNEFE